MSIVRSGKKQDILDAVETFSAVLRHIPLPSNSSRFQQAHKEVSSDMTAIVMNGQRYCGAAELDVLMTDIEDYFMAFSHNLMGMEEANDLMKHILCSTSRSCCGSDALFALYRLFASEEKRLLIKPRSGVMQPTEIEMYASSHNTLQCTVHVSTRFGLFVHEDLEYAVEEPEPFLTLEAVIKEVSTVTMPFTSETDLSSPLYYDHSDDDPSDLSDAEVDETEANKHAAQAVWTPGQESTMGTDDEGAEGGGDNHDTWENQQDVTQWLMALKIKPADATKYAASLDGLGVDCVDHLPMVEESDLENMGMKKIHQRIVLKHLSNAGQAGRVETPSPQRATEEVAVGIGGYAMPCVQPDSDDDEEEEEEDEDEDEDEEEDENISAVADLMCQSVAPRASKMLLPMASRLVDKETGGLSRSPLVRKRIKEFISAAINTIVLMFAMGGLIKVKRAMETKASKLKDWLKARRGARRAGSGTGSSESEEGNLTKDECTKLAVQQLFSDSNSDTSSSSSSSSSGGGGGGGGGGGSSSAAVPRSSSRPPTD
jgi:hypothetical protein